MMACDFQDWIYEVWVSPGSGESSCPAVTSPQQSYVEEWRLPVHTLMGVSLGASSWPVALATEYLS